MAGPHTVMVDFTAPGVVEDFSDVQREQTRTRVHGAVQATTSIRLSDISVSVAPASVRVTVILRASTAAEAAAAEAEPEVLQYPPLDPQRLDLDPHRRRRRDRAGVVDLSSGRNE